MKVPAVAFLIRKALYTALKNIIRDIGARSSVWLERRSYMTAPYTPAKKAGGLERL